MADFDDIPDAPRVPGPNEPLPVELNEAVLSYRSVAEPDASCPVCRLALSARSAMGALEGYLQDCGARAWEGVSIADVVYTINGELSALGQQFVSDKHVMNHLENHVDFDRLAEPSAAAMVRRPPQAMQEAREGELLVGVDDNSAAGQLWGALEELKQVQRILHDQFIKQPQHLAYDKEGNPLGSPRISAKEVQAYVQTVKAMKEMVDSLQKIRSGEHALQVAIRTGVDEALGAVHIHVMEELRRMTKSMVARDMTSGEAADLIEDWLTGTTLKSFEAMLHQTRESAFRSAARLQGVSTESVRR